MFRGVKITATPVSFVRVSGERVEHVLGRIFDSNRAVVH